MTTGTYLLGIAELVVFAAALGFAAYHVRVWLVPSWYGSIARLVEVVISLALAIWLGELLGLVGLLKEIPLLVCAVAVAVAAWRLVPLPAERVRLPAITPYGLAAGVGIAALVIAKWALGTLPILDTGMFGFDTMQYHMPIAAGFAQSGSVTGIHYIDPTYLSWFDPANSELIHGEGIALVGSDIMSPLLNLAWACLALLAAWCIGRPHGRAPHSMLATATLLVSPIFLLRQPGEAMSDAAATALLLCAAAILVVGFDSPDRRKGALVMTPTIPLAAIAAGLALGAKANLAPIVVLLGAGVVVISGRGLWTRTALIWIAGALSTGGFWYLRNLIVAGNPLPWFGIGPLPATHQLIMAFPGSKNYSVAHYLTDGQVWAQYLRPGLKIAFGDLWPLVLGLVAVGSIGAFVLRNTPVQRVLGVVALVGIVSYVVSPGTAPGLPGHPSLFPANLRYVLPVVALALAMLPTLAFARNRWATPAIAVLLIAVLVADIRENSPLSDPYLGGAMIVMLGVLLCLALAGGCTTGKLRPLDGALYGAALLGVAAILYWPQVEQYMSKRYTNVWPGMDVARSFRWAKGIENARIALAGTTGAAFQYAYYGDDSSNSVTYLGEHGPRGSFNPIQTCQRWREAVNKGDYDYVITTPSLNYYTLGTGFSPEQSWTAPGAATTEVLHEGRTAIFRIDGHLKPAGCNVNGPPFSGLAPLLTGS
jgi:hypothetical protein